MAEAKIHGKSLYEVHFHEVGGGFVNCDHGLIPVPAPATVEILRNISIKLGIVPFETTTPTGAAILAANVEEFTGKIEFSIDKIGYGIGNRDLEIPNVLRVYLGKEGNGVVKGF